MSRSESSTSPTERSAAEGSSAAERCARRSFLFGAGLAIGGIAGLVRRAVGATPDSALRPPGAREGDGFLAACIRCGECVQACPHQTLALERGADLAHGAPTFQPRQTPCTLCLDLASMPCIDACPTDALVSLAEPADARMGLAVVDDTTCWPFQGIVCRSCWHACPFPDAALKLDARLRPVVDADHCTGCGLCTHACPADPGAIPIRPLGPGPRSEPARSES